MTLNGDLSELPVILRRYPIDSEQKLSNWYTRVIALQSLVIIKNIRPESLHSNLCYSSVYMEIKGLCYMFDILTLVGAVIILRILNFIGTLPSWVYFYLRGLSKWQMLQRGSKVLR